MLTEDAECDWTLLGMFPTATGKRPRGQAATNRKDVKSLPKNAAYVVRLRWTRLIPEQEYKTGPGKLVYMSEPRAM
jgi:hypothetical protein